MRLVVEYAAVRPLEQGTGPVDRVQADRLSARVGRTAHGRHVVGQGSPVPVRRADRQRLQRPLPAVPRPAEPDLRVRRPAGRDGRARGRRQHGGVRARGSGARDAVRHEGVQHVPQPRDVRRRRGVAAGRRRRPLHVVPPGRLRRQRRPLRHVPVVRRAGRVPVLREVVLEREQVRGPCRRQVRVLRPAVGGGPVAGHRVGGPRRPRRRRLSGRARRVRATGVRAVDRPHGRHRHRAQPRRARGQQVRERDRGRPRLREPDARARRPVGHLHRGRLGRGRRASPRLGPG